MGGGKGSVDHYVAVMKPETILFEMDGVDEKIAQEALRKASSKASACDKIYKARSSNTMKKTEMVQAKSHGELERDLLTCEEELKTLRFDRAFNKLKNVKAIGRHGKRARGSSLYFARNSWYNRFLLQYHGKEKYKNEYCREKWYPMPCKNSGSVGNKHQKSIRFIASVIR